MRIIMSILVLEPNSLLISSVKLYVNKKKTGNFPKGDLNLLN